MSQNNPFQAYYSAPFNIATGANQTFSPGIVEPWQCNITLDTDTTIEVKLNGGNVIKLTQYQTLNIEQKVTSINIKNTGGVNAATGQIIVIGE